MKSSEGGFGFLEIIIIAAIIAVFATVTLKFYAGGSSGQTPTETLRAGQSAIDRAKELQKSADDRNAAEQRRLDAIK